LGFPLIESRKYLDRLLRELARNSSKVFFLQIGANDGKRFDPIWDFVNSNRETVSGIVVEPVQEYFEELRNNYNDFTNIVTINAAIHNTKRRMEMYVFDSKKASGFDGWVKGIASFNAAHHTLSGIPKAVMRKVSVPCLSLESLILARQINHLDLLLIDTEGYDAQILMSIDFDLIKPSLIYFEHGIPSGVMSRRMFRKVANRLTRNGYRLFIDNYDAIAIGPVCKDVPVEMADYKN